MLVFTCLAQVQTSMAQTVWTTESFGTGSARGTLANGFVGDWGTWSTSTTGTNGANANEWYVSVEECGNAVGTCGSACPGGENSLHISAIGGLCGTPDCGAAYDETSALNQTNKQAESPVINCMTYAGITLSFDYIAAQGDDGFTVVYSPDGGGTWSTIATPGTSQCCDCDDALLCAFLGICCATGTVACTGLEQGEWASYSVILPASADDNNNVKIGFEWSNDGDGLGTDPSVAIDDITLAYDGILSEDLDKFDGIAGPTVNFLNWTTSEENNIDHFILEHSIDGKSFFEISKIEYDGGNNYQYAHQYNFNGNYYRLKTYNVNGKLISSERIYLSNEENEGITVFQTPNGIRIEGITMNNPSITLYSMDGKPIANVPLVDKLQNGLFINDIPGFNSMVIIKLEEKGKSAVVKGLL